MKKIILICFLLIFFLLNFIFSKTIPLIEKKSKVNVDDLLILNSGPLNKNTNFVDVEINGDSLKFLKKEGNPSKGYTFIFKAVSVGKAVIIKRISRKGKGKDRIIEKRYYLLILPKNSSNEAECKCHE